MKKIRQVVIVADLQYDDQEYNLAALHEAVPDFLASALDPAENPGGYRLINPSFYLSLGDFDAERADQVGPFCHEYYRTFTIEVYPSKEGGWRAWCFSHAWLPVELWARNGYGGIAEAKGETPDEALRNARAAIDARLASRTRPDVDESDYAVCEDRYEFEPHPATDRGRKLGYLQYLQKEINRLRLELKVAAPDEVLCRYEDPCDDRLYLAVADGFGKATAIEIEGNFPVDYFTHRSQECETEDEACRLAAKWAGEDEEEDEDDPDAD